MVWGFDPWPLRDGASNQSKLKGKPCGMCPNTETPQQTRFSSRSAVHIQESVPFRNLPGMGGFLLNEPRFGKTTPNRLGPHSFAPTHRPPPSSRRRCRRFPPWRTSRRGGSWGWGEGEGGFGVGGFGLGGPAASRLGELNLRSWTRSGPCFLGSEGAQAPAFAKRFCCQTVSGES